MAQNDQDFINTVLTACHADISGPEPSEPSRLFHLTDTDGILGILDSKKLWASLATSLNDCREIRYALDLAEEIIGACIEARPSEYYSSLLTYLRDPSSAPPEVKAEVSAFVVAFCDKCDRSGQWLHYGRNGRGIAVGFSSNIAKAMRRDLVKVDCDVESQKKRLSSLIDVGRAIVDKFPSDMADKLRISQARLTGHIVSLYVPMLAATMKHPSFSEEREWRLVGHQIVLNGKIQGKSGRDEIKYRRSNERLVPYEELSFADVPNAISEVVVGYSAASTLDAIRVLLQDKGFDVPVRRSEVPVR
jgi:hypothetical protein